MASDPNSIADLPDPRLIRAPPSTYGLNYASRTRAVINTNSPGPFSPNSSDGTTKIANRGQNIVVDFTDAERFMDAASLEIRFKFTPFFYKSHDRASVNPVTIPYPKGASPVLDQSILALIRRITIGNPQGLIIEEINRQNILANIINFETFSPDITTYNSSFNNTAGSQARRGYSAQVEACDDAAAFTPDAGYLTEPIYNVKDAADNYLTGADFSLQPALGSYIKGQTTGQTAAFASDYQSARNCVLRLSTSSFFNRNPMQPLFVYRNGLRITIELEDPRIAFYNNYAGFDQISPSIHYVPIAPRYSDDFVSHYSTGSRTAATRGTPFLAMPSISFSSQGYQKMPLVPGDRVSFVFGTGSKVYNDAGTLLTRNFLNSNEVIQTAFVTVHEVAPVTATQAVGGAGGTIVYFAQDAFNYVVAGPVLLAMRFATLTASPATVHVLTLAANNGLPFYPAPGTALLEWDLIGLYIEKTWTPYINYNINAIANPLDRIPYTTTNLASTSIVPDPNYFNATLNPVISSAATSAYFPGWDYSLDNVQFFADYYKPNVNVYSSYVDQFKQPSGIPFVFTRVMYHSFNIPGGASVSPNITLPFQYRSLRALLAVITDEFSVNPSTGATSYNFPALSSFMTRGLQEAKVFVGATQFPAQPIRLVDGQLKLFQENEIRSIFGLLGNPDYNCNFPFPKLRTSTRNYKKCGNFDAAVSFDYRDTSRFVLGFDLSKRQNDFAVGIDTSQGVTVSANFTFESHGAPRNRLIHFFAMVDTILTVQNSSVEVRY